MGRSSAARCHQEMLQRGLIGAGQSLGPRRVEQNVRPQQSGATCFENRIEKSAGKVPILGQGFSRLTHHDCTMFFFGRANRSDERLGLKLECLDFCFEW